MNATVTDANLVLGWLNPDYFLGGRMKLDHDKAVKALGRVAERLGTGVEKSRCRSCGLPTRTWPTP